MKRNRLQLMVLALLLTTLQPAQAIELDATTSAIINASYNLGRLVGALDQACHVWKTFDFDEAFFAKYVNDVRVSYSAYSQRDYMNKTALFGALDSTRLGTRYPDCLKIIKRYW
jgi:ABC-type protease/lipase transport system fused ATPase/permease subunit